MSLIYFCTNENNTCPKKDICKRYLKIENEDYAPLYRVMCTENNNYILFIEAEKDNTEIMKNE